MANTATKGNAGISMMVIVAVAQCVFAWIEAAAHAECDVEQQKRPKRSVHFAQKIHGERVHMCPEGCDP